MSIFSKYVGLPYVHAGRDEKGYDCWGLVLAVYRDLGIELWDYKELYTPSKEWDTSVFLRAYKLQNEWSEVSDRRRFDALLFRNAAGIGTHVGVVVDDFSFIHAVRKVGVVMTPIHVMRDKILGIYRHKAVGNDTSQSD
jgi:cell wall-associated NlpC family hydrolase